MPIQDEYSKQLARFIFEHFGYTVTDIPETNESRSADLYITTADNRLPSAIVEAKQKQPDPNEAAERERALAAGELHERDAVIEEQSTLNRIMDDAIQQIIETVPRYPENTLRLVFIVCSGFNAEQRFDQFKVRILGSACVVDPIGEGTSQDCLCFRQSDIHKYRNHVDGFVLVKDHPGDDGMEAALFINPYASGYALLSSAESLRNEMGEGFVDIPRRDIDGEIWSLHDREGDRTDESRMLELVREKYGLSERTLTITMNYFAAETMVPRSQE